MEEVDILAQVISNIIRGAKNAGLGKDAIKIANSIEGLSVHSDGGLTITSDILKILGDLIHEYEKATKAKMSGEVNVTLHFIRYAHTISKE